MKNHSDKKKVIVIFMIEIQIYVFLDKRKSFLYIIQGEYA